ncbi:GGDEF domain-containing protein [Pseudonocardia phyllosphaerae]|uniref:GGDEF domain-containing protein n=1 Tax=Pseudonocardia phyllosphaerae TaxID=3390502 RepID=UPI00397B7F02
MTDTAWTVRKLVRSARRVVEPSPEARSAPSAERPSEPLPEVTASDDVVASTPSAQAALHTAAAERLAGNGRYEQAYLHLREAVRLLNGLPDGPAAPSEAELDRLRREHAEAHEQSRRDSLTSSYNRRYLDERLADLLSGTDGRPVCLALADIDHFKQVNDTHGHPFGDRVLQRMVDELDDALPRGAFCARYGGEEFALVLPGLDSDAGVAACEAARERVASHDWSALHPELRVTISIGIAHTGSADGVDPLVAEADVLLYTAKQAGRNAVAYRSGEGRVVLAGAAAGRRSVPQPDPAPYRPGPRPHLPAS